MKHGLHININGLPHIFDKPFTHIDEIRDRRLPSNPVGLLDFQPH
jgi:hypothetical protein